MNVSQALEHANSLFIPDLLFSFGNDAVQAECAKNEEAIKVLREAWDTEESPGFSFDIVRDLADRNRALCDELDQDALTDRRGMNLTRGLSDVDLVRGVAVLQGRDPDDVARDVRGGRGAIGTALATSPVRGAVAGVDIETTSRDPDRGYIINIGWEFMDLAPEAEPVGGRSFFCGLPEAYQGKKVPLERIHHITMDDLEGHLPFREDKKLQANLLALLEACPYMAHNAAFEDSWFMLHLDGYAESRKAGRIVPVDTRDICRSLDRDAALLPRESNPASLQNWARRRGTLAAGENERHLGLDDTDLMLRTVREEFELRNIFA